MSLSGSPGTLNVNSAVAGYQPDAAVNSASTWNISTNNAAMKMVGRIDSAMPAGLTLEVSLQAPGGASGLGYQTLGTASTDLVSGIGRGFASGLTINYRLTATVDAATGPGGRTVTFSLVSE